MSKINDILSELGVSKVRLAKYLGVSRQMLYNYLGIEDINNWPKEKAAKLLSLLNIEKIEDLASLKITGDYIIEVENRLNEGVKDSSNKEIIADLKGFNKKEQELLSDINQGKHHLTLPEVLKQNTPKRFRLKLIKWICLTL